MKIASGGQTGVDQGALEAAVKLGLEIGGWAPHGWIAEKPLGHVPECYRGKMREFADCGSNAENYRRRTKANVLDSHATLIIVDDYPLTGGTLNTRRHCEQVMRPHFVVALSETGAARKVRDWLDSFSLGDRSAPFVLNVAGPRESKSPGIQRRVCEFLLDVLGNMVNTENKESCDGR